ncbi:MAG: hypothetical protein VYE00_16400 [Candidatus Poribacteria bacterium]|jgi:hypothetical protein|nr:hypothetical protein [Candidatus Poribacteria bacterium]MEC8841136.1 hypothetical protein [Candidatus Poribacteria bacterium]MEC8892237.1 hypothetical protein [Candidatus Poribacteria bacterium]
MKVTRKVIIICVVIALVILGIMVWYGLTYKMYDPEAGRTW